MEYQQEHLELVGGDAAKLEEILNAYESDRIKARQTVIDSTKSELRAFQDLGLTPAEIKEFKERKPGESEADVQKRIDQAIQEAATQQREAADKRTRNAEVRAVAAELGFAKPAQALALLDQSKLAAVKVNDDGDADSAAVKTLLEDLAKDSPYLLKPTDTTPGHRDAGIGGAGSGAKPDVQPGAARLRHAYAESK